MDKIVRFMRVDRIEEVLKNFKKGEIYRAVIDDTEKVLLEKALEHAGGNQLEASRFLGLNRNTLRSKLRKFNINTQKYRL